LYKGDFEMRRRSAPPPAVPLVPPDGAGPAIGSARFMERRLPWVSDRASAVAMTGLRSWMRAPELKMMLLTPVIMLVVFAGMFQNGPAHELLRTLSATGLVAFMLVIGMIGPVGNQFGFDRAGFRAFVLSPVPRRDVLIGKNLSVLPYAIVATVVVVAVSQWFSPMRLDHVVAILVQTVPMYLAICVAGNLLSIVGAMALKPGSAMPARHQGIRQLYSILFMVLIPLPLGLTLLPLGIESLLWPAGLGWFPAYLVLGTVQAAVAVWLYSLALDWQGDLLQRREQQILDIVAARTE
jgi:ABC-2 type transport system permease protein